MNPVELIKTAEQPTAVIHETIPMAELPSFIGRAFGQVATTLQQQGVAPVGPPFAMYFGKPGQTVEVEAGFPIARAVKDTGAVHPGHLPGTAVARTVHAGPYEKLAETYAGLMSWAAERGLEPASTMWEVYLSDPSRQPDPKTWRTEVYWPVS